ncbi:MAG: hypothetical protein EAZ97_03385 [Bacteroidetes bacterium]|nr:MAG: hypothetical protein EAZ97_03385 [Bacteroidota bacterium]
MKNNIFIAFFVFSFLFKGYSQNDTIILNKEYNDTTIAIISYLPSSLDGDEGYLLVGSLKDDTPDSCTLVKYNFVTQEYYPIVSFATNYLVFPSHLVRIDNIIQIVYKDINTDEWNMIKIFEKQVLFYQLMGGDDKVDNWLTRIYSPWKFKEYYGKLYVQTSVASMK